MRRENCFETEINIDSDLFGQDNIDFLMNTMWLDLEQIQQEIMKYHPELKSYFNCMFTLMRTRYEYFKEQFDICGTAFIINNEIISECNGINEQYKDNYIAVELCHVYRSFCQGGIEDAWLYSQPEEWYPRIIFKERIESDIDTLDEHLVVYRGTRIEEYESVCYGQAWTLSLGVAQKFAFSQYEHATSSHGERVVLKANIRRDDVFFYKINTTAKENEVIVDCEKLDSVVILYKKRTAMTKRKQRSN